MSEREITAVAPDRIDNSEAVLVWWAYAPGICRFQTSSPEIAKKLSQRSAARLVAWSVRGGYLRVFEEHIEPWRARQLVKRYLAATNGAFFNPKRPPSRRKSSGIVMQRSSPVTQ